MKIIFATFEIDLSPHTTQHVLSIEPHFIRHRPKELIQALFASARHHHPDCRTIILTDLSTPHEYAEKTEIFRFDIDSKNPILSRTQAQLEFIKANQGENHIVFLDSDMLIQTYLDPLFEKPFDIGLSYRQHSMPINGGLIFVNGRSHGTACHFFETLLKVMEEEFQHLKAWYGDQLALADAVPLPQITDEQEHLFTHAGIRFLLLPASQYNFTTVSRNMDGDYPEKKILHFKGTRKRFLLPYFQSHFL